jgi:hypothetical protein
MSFSVEGHFFRDTHDTLQPIIDADCLGKHNRAPDLPDHRRKKPCLGSARK